MCLPSLLLNAVAASGGGRIVLVIGAGCSIEEPTGLPSAGICSEAVHRQLVDDGILVQGECAEPWNLSALADLVKGKCAGKQEELVRRLPISKFKNASPNEGHKIAAVLLIEGAVSSIVTLNFDLALSHALSVVGAGSEVSIINGPQQHDQLGRSTLVYLHRCIDADPEDLILTTDALDGAWIDAWEQCVANWALAVPITVFAGIGSSCGVLRHTADRLKTALGNRVQLYLANPADRLTSAFAQEIGVSDDNYVRLPWIAFMRKLGSRFHRETVARVRGECHSLSVREGWIDSDTGRPSEDIDSLAAIVADFDLLAFGRTRSAWFLDSRDYLKLEDGHISSIADLLLAVGFISRLHQLALRFNEDGFVDFLFDEQPHVRVRLVDGSSRNYRWLTLETDLRRFDATRQRQRAPVTRVLACGVTGRKPDIATPPISITGNGDDSDSIIDGDSRYSFWAVDEIRGDTSSLEELLA